MRRIVRVIGGPWWTALAVTYVVTAVSLWLTGSIYAYFAMLPSVFIVYPWLLYGLVLPAAFMLDSLPGDLGPGWTPLGALAYFWVLVATAAVNFALFRVGVAALAAAAREFGLCRHGRPALPVR